MATRMGFLDWVLPRTSAGVSDQPGKSFSASNPFSVKGWRTADSVILETQHWNPKEQFFFSSRDGDLGFFPPWNRSEVYGPHWRG
ncbi:hypothetical protein CHARACLAT_016354 [Characodon lateralis]|uniref:Uncharacterized protein n=1 Tax=Characodon lateralis TaxID=208331 RepID=A0ABU7EAB1_9TELE|nr:hypothetical protein [Characodon lateralis]